MKKLVSTPLILLVFSLALQCHGAPSTQNDIDKAYRTLNETIDRIVKEQVTDALKQKRLITPAQILKEINDKVKALKEELDGLEDKQAHKRPNEHTALDRVHEKMPQRVIVHTNCPSACVKVECYAAQVMFLKTVNEEKRYLCTLDCGRKCRKFLKDTMACYSEQVSGECGLHESHDLNIKLACDDRMTKCLLEKVKEDELGPEENSLTVGTNDKYTPDRKV